LITAELDKEILSLIFLIASGWFLCQEVEAGFCMEEAGKLHAELREGCGSWGHKLKLAVIYHKVGNGYRWKPTILASRKIC
jgi:hypothetical protein